MFQSQRSSFIPLVVAAGILALSGFSYWFCRRPLQPGHSLSLWSSLTQPDAEQSIKENVKDAGTMRKIPLLPSYQEVGSFVGQFQSLMAIAVDSKGNVYGADSELHTIRKYTPDGKLLLSFGEKGTEVGFFNEPRGIGIDEKDFVYVMDTWNGRVQKFTSDGQFVTVFGIEQGLFGPRALAVGNGLVHVVDSGNGRIVVYTTEGAFVRQFGRKGHKAGELWEPVGIATNTSGDVFVLDSGNDRIEKFSAIGEALAILHVPGWSTKTLKEAQLTTTSDSCLFVIDPIFGTVAVFGPDDSLMGRLGEHLNTPSGIATQEKKVLIAERRSGVIKIFATR